MPVATTGSPVDIPAPLSAWISLLRAVPDLGVRGATRACWKLLVSQYPSSHGHPAGFGFVELEDKQPLIGTVQRVLSGIRLQLAIAVTHSLFPFLGV